MEVSTGDDDVTKKSAGDDTGDGRASSTQPITPIPISSNVSKHADPSVVDRAALTDPPASRRRRKHPHLFPSENNHYLWQIR
jgi:hypothetical protein